MKFFEMKFNPKEPGLYSQLNTQGVIEIGVLGGCQSDQGSGKNNNISLPESSW